MKHPSYEIRIIYHDKSPLAEAHFPFLRNASFALALQEELANSDLG
jgi:hypothetical protein